MRNNVLIVLVLLIQGCGGKSTCQKACKMKADCLQSEDPGWKCPLSAECDPIDECFAKCILGASCEAITAKDAQGAAALKSCEALCSGGQPDRGVASDHGSAPDGPEADRSSAPDLSWPDFPRPDQHVWPDLYVPQHDQFVWPDTYSAKPFGCESDDECFGQLCCKTPWGVKMCASTCLPSRP
jgi:hypothetical protein